MASLWKYGVSTFSQALRAVKIVIGFTLLLTGIALIVLPGPAFVVIPLALGILAGEFVWAKKLLARFDGKLRSVIGVSKGQGL